MESMPSIGFVKLIIMGLFIAGLIVIVGGVAAFLYQRVQKEES